ncbi:MAG: DUF4164 family protein [Alphaproteobacteria bacterium]|nr:DUF4164 family protein [Alphaproteobacteria bacterium]
MSALDDAMDRFSQALDRLETALGRRLKSAEAGGDLEKELSALREDRARLKRELEAARADYAKLEKTTDQVSGRLDGTISELKSMLGGE